MKISVCRLTLSTGLMLLLQSGCSSMNQAAPMSTNQVERLQERLGTIGVVSARYVPKVELQTPAKGALAGAGRGAARMAGEPIFVAANSGNAAVAVVGVLLSPIMAVAGGVSGAMTAESSRSVEEKEAALKKALVEMKIQETMSARFLKMTAEIAGYQFKQLEGQGPLAESEQPDYRSLKASGIDTVQELSVREFGLEGDGQVDPLLMLYLQAQVRLVGTTGQKTIFMRTFTCESGKHKFPYWTSDEAVHFRDELSRCYDDIAASMASELYQCNTISRGPGDRARLSTGRPR